MALFIVSTQRRRHGPQLWTTQRFTRGVRAMVTVLPDCYSLTGKSRRGGPLPPLHRTDVVNVSRAVYMTSAADEADIWWDAASKRRHVVRTSHAEC